MNDISENGKVSESMENLSEKAFEDGGGTGETEEITEEADLLGDSSDMENNREMAMDDCELEAIKARVREMEEEAEKLKQLQSEVDKQMNMGSPSSNSGTPLSMEDKVEVDARSVYVGNVDYGATAEELEQHFHGCGSMNRITILCNKLDGHPKGFAYIEFTDRESIRTAMALDESLFRGRQIKVMPKRTNRPGMSRTERPPRGRGRGGGYSRGNFRGRGFAYRGHPRPRKYRRVAFFTPY